MSQKQRLEAKEFQAPPTHPGLTQLRDMVGFVKRTVTGHSPFPLTASPGSLSCRPLFIVSAGRSGTTLLRSMIAANGEIAIPPEGLMIGPAVRKYLALQAIGWKDMARLTVALFESGEQFPLWKVNMAPVQLRVVSLSEEERSLARIIDEVYTHYASEHFPNARLWGDQSPINALFLPWIVRAFPHGRYLHLLRDGRDVVASILSRDRALPYATRRWMISVNKILAAQKELPPDQFLEVRYESLVSEPEATLRAVCGFAGIEYDARMLDYWKSPTTIEHRYFDHHRNLSRPVFTDSVGRWKERLSEEQQEYVLKRITPLLQELDYVPAREAKQREGSNEEPPGKVPSEGEKKVPGPPHSPRVTYLRDVAGYLKRTVMGRNRYPVAGRPETLSCRPLLFVSAGRSGTTLLRSMLVAGGEIAIPPEGQGIGPATRKFRAWQHLGWNDLVRLTVGLFESSSRFFEHWDTNLAAVYPILLSLPAGERSLARVIDQIYLCYRAQHFPEARLWGDQSPLNALLLPWIRHLFPDARYLHVLRDGRDVAASWYVKGHPLEYGTQRWMESVKRSLLAQQKLPPWQFLEVRYESLVSEPEDTLRKVCDFADIMYDPRMLEYWKLPTTIEHRHFSHHRNLSRPVFTGSVGRWEERLSEEQQAFVMAEMRPLLERVGYLGP